MELLYNPIFLGHDTGLHPESMKRIEVFNDLPHTAIESGEAYLSLVHTEEYIKKIKSACDGCERIDADTLTSSGSYEAAIHAVGAAIKASEQGDFALVRPPGHHAYKELASGFCLFNNIAIATQKLVNEGKKVLIIDFDGHYGDGTADIFYDTKEVLFWSLHQYPAFPHKGFLNEIGEGEGKGYTVNIPLPSGSADDVFWNAFNTFLPIAKQFEPDVIAVSAGFDAHRYDPLLQLNLSSTTFYELGIIIKENFENVFAVLEGGYNVDVLRQCVFNFLAGINGEAIPHLDEPTSSNIKIREEFEYHLHAAISNLSPYWKI